MRIFTQQRRTTHREVVRPCFFVLTCRHGETVGSCLEKRGAWRKEHVEIGGQWFGAGINQLAQPIDERYKRFPEEFDDCVHVDTPVTRIGQNPRPVT